MNRKMLTETELQKLIINILFCLLIMAVTNFARQGPRHKQHTKIRLQYKHYQKDENCIMTDVMPINGIRERRNKSVAFAVLNATYRQFSKYRYK